MAEHYKAKNVAELNRLIRMRVKRMHSDTDKALRSAARKSVNPIRKRAPKAFGELQNSVQDYTKGSNGNPVVAVDAPHAAAVEIGSPPHKPDFEKLLAWVRLRGLQGLNRSGKTIRKRFPRELGPTTPHQAPRVASLLKKLEVRGKRGVGRHSPSDAAVQVARAISNAIEKKGTRPHFFVRESMTEIAQIALEELKRFHP